MDRLSGLDASFLYFENSAHLMHVCGLIELDATTIPGGYNFEAMRAAMGKRLGENPAFRRKLYDPIFNLDHPIWVDDDEFDIEHHVRRTTVAAPAGREELADVCSDLAAQPLDRNRPLWEFWIIEGLPDGRLAVFTKMHHATVDGVSGASLVSELCSLEPDAPPMNAPRSQPAAKPPSDAEIFIDGLIGVAKRPIKFARLLPGTVGVLPTWINRARDSRAMPAPFRAPRTSFNGTVTSHRTTAFTQLNLEDIKTVKNAFDCTVNDVVLAVCSGALRKYLEDRNELPDTSLIAMVPVSVHGKSSAPGANKVSGMFTKLASDIKDPVARVQAIAAQNRISKDHFKTISASMLQDWAQFAMPNTFGMAVRVYSKLRLAERHAVIHNLVISNVPGPPMPIYLMGGRIVGFYPFGPVFHGAGLNITVISNDGHVDVGIIACREQAPLLWELADDLPLALDELVKAATATTSAPPRKRTPQPKPV